MLRKMWERLSGGTLDEQQARMWLTLTWYSAMRRSETQSLLWKDVKITDRGCLITIVVSKTGFNQQVAINFKPNDEMCPVAALQRWKQVTAANTRAARLQDNQRWRSAHDEADSGQDDGEVHQRRR